MLADEPRKVVSFGQSCLLCWTDECGLGVDVVGSLLLTGSNVALVDRCGSGVAVRCVLVGVRVRRGVAAGVVEQDLRNVRVCE